LNWEKSQANFSLPSSSSPSHPLAEQSKMLLFCFRFGFEGGRKFAPRELNFGTAKVACLRFFSFIVVVVVVVVLVVWMLKKEEEEETKFYFLKISEYDFLTSSEIIKHITTTTIMKKGGKTFELQKEANL